MPDSLLNSCTGYIRSLDKDFTTFGKFLIPNPTCFIWLQNLQHQHNSVLFFFFIYINSWGWGSLNPRCLCWKHKELSYTNWYYLEDMSISHISWVENHIPVLCCFMTDNMNKQRCKLQWHLFFQIQTLSSSSFFFNFVVYMFFDNSIIGGGGI